MFSYYFDVRSLITISHITIKMNICVKILAFGLISRNDKRAVFVSFLGRAAKRARKRVDAFVGRSVGRNSEADC